MSFFSDNKNFGLAMIIAGLVTALVAIISIFYPAFTVGGAVTAIGSVIYGLMIMGVGSSTRKGEISQKLDILAKYVYVVGAGTIIMAVFSAAGMAINGGVVGLLAGIIAFIIALIIGLVIIWAGKKMTDGAVSTIDRIIWILLVLLFVISILGALVQLFGGILGIILGICNIIIFVFLLAALFDPEVKKAMGMD